MAEHEPPRSMTVEPNMAAAIESLEQLIARLDELDGKATPGEWSTFGQAGITSAVGENLCIAQCWAYAGDRSGDGHDNRAFIIALRNAYGALRAAGQRALSAEAADRKLEAAQAHVEQLVQELAMRNQELEALRGQLAAASEAAERLGQMLRQAIAPTPKIAPAETMANRSSTQTSARPPGELPHIVHPLSGRPVIDDDRPVF